MSSRKENIERILFEIKWSQAELAKKLGMTRGGLNYHFTKKSDLDEELYDKILNLLSSQGVNVENYRSISNSNIHNGEINKEIIGLLKHMITTHEKRIESLEKSLLEKNQIIKELTQQKGK